MASRTRFFVVSSTFVRPFETRETVCDETPAALATSPMDGPRDARLVPDAGFRVPFDGLAWAVLLPLSSCMFT